MDSFEWNKVLAAVFASVLFIMVIGIVAEQPFHQEHVKPAFSIEVATADAADVVVEEGPSFAELMAGADAARGARQWAKCRACHTVEKDGRNGTGPNLYGIVGRTIAALDDFNYSNALRGIQTSVWTYESLDEWLLSPKSFANGTSMSFAGLRKPEQRADLIAYLSTFTDAPVPLPVVEAVEQVEDVE
ncbi:c-type cytochrome [Kordiimonas aquimaris]|uniref:c-type cytochrome n=1 Tax=Kordiimonas aquimaris TaxID=707591 RepID=UPI0021D13D0A|nr:cytochrome c family protein [Kordiimonas aquimaris]